MLKGLSYTLITSTITQSLLGNFALADTQYMLVLKSPQAFLANRDRMEEQSLFHAKGMIHADDKDQKRGFLKAQVSESLNNISSLLVEVGSAADAQKLAKQEGVLGVDQEVIYKAPRLYLPAREGAGATLNAQTLAMPASWGIQAVKADNAWPESNLGQGVRALIVDGGIDRKHPAIAPNFEAGKNFVGKDESAFADTDGHGTHVAGILAGSALPGGFSGVAPKAKILAARACDDDGCSSFAIARGINWGIAQKVDLISMSLGSSTTNLVDRIAVKSALAAGITIIAATGNDGAPDVYFPAATPGVIAVGAVNPELHRASFSNYGPEVSVVAPGVDVMSSVPVGSGRVPMITFRDIKMTDSLTPVMAVGSAEPLIPISGHLVLLGLGTKQEYTQAQVNGKIALVHRGAITFEEKVQNAMAAGARGLILIDNQDEEKGLPVIRQDNKKVKIPVFMMTKAKGQELVNRLAERGSMTASLVMQRTSFAKMSGTSMATPHVAGIVALIKAANRSLSPAQVKSILLKTSLPLKSDVNEGVGAGMVNAVAAVEMAKNFAP